MGNSLTLTKKELAFRCEVGAGKVRQWCNVDYYEELTKLGYKRKQKTFTPKQTEFLRQNLLEYKE